MENLDRAAKHAVHLHVRDKPATGGPKLLSLAGTGHFRSQSEHLIDTNFDFQRAYWLSLAYIDPKISIGNTLSPLSGTGGLLQIIIANTAFGTVSPIRQSVDGQPVVRFDVTVAARKSNTETRHSPIQPFVVALHKDLPVPVAHTTAAEFELFRNTYAHHQRLCHPSWTHPVCPGSLMLAL